MRREEVPEHRAVAAGRQGLPALHLRRVLEPRVHVAPRGGGARERAPEVRARELDTQRREHVRRDGASVGCDLDRHRERVQNIF